MFRRVPGRVLLLFAFARVSQATNTTSVFLRDFLPSLEKSRRCDTANYYHGQELYRLGDMVKGSFQRSAWDEQDHHLRFPGSLASEYMKMVPAGRDALKFSALSKLVHQRALTFKTAEIPSPNEVIVHVRTGDIIDQDFRNSVEDMLEHRVYFYENNYEMYNNYAKPLDYFERHLADTKLKKIVLVSASHIKLENGYKKSCLYLTALSTYLENLGFSVRLRTGKLPDDDVIFMSNASEYLATGGFFSWMISMLVKFNGGIVIPIME
jgi:hypothetical protein